LTIPGTSALAVELSTLIDDHIGFIAQAASFLLAGTRIPSIYASLRGSDEESGPQGCRP
jgi:hypothetical protein